MKKLRKIIFIIVLALLFISVLNTNQVKAMTGSVDASIGKTSLSIGESIKLTVTATNSAVWYNVKTSDASIVSVSPTSGDIDSGYEKTDSATHTLTAKKAGKVTITVQSSSARAYDEKKLTLSKTFTITVTDPTPTNPPPTNPGGNSNNNGGGNTPSKSSDNSLKSLTVGSKNYSKPNKDITVPSVSSGTTSIELKAEANDSKAKVTGTGTKELTTGTNKFTITVTAENGTKANYVVRITRLAEETNKPNVVDNSVPERPTENEYETPTEEPEPELRLTSLEIPEVELTPIFNSEVFEYTIYLVDEEEINITAVPNLEGATVEITGNTGLVEGENTIVIKLTKDDKTAEYKIVANKWSKKEIEEEIKQEIQNNDDDKKGFLGIITDWWNRSGPMSVIFTVVLALLGASIIFAIISYKYSNTVNKVSKHSRENFITNDDLFSEKK